MFVEAGWLISFPLLLSAAGVGGSGAAPTPLPGLAAGWSLPPSAPAPHDDRLDRVGERLLETLERRDARVDLPGWPPSLAIAESRRPGCSIACADRVAGPRVTLHPAAMSGVLGSNDDLLAFVVAHELGHLVLGHVDRTPSGGGVVLRSAVSQEEEVAADHWGMQLAVEAGYSQRRALWGILEWTASEGDGDPARLAGLFGSHPSWAERGTLLSQFLGDAEAEALWAAVVRFRDGAHLLSLRQFELAALVYGSLAIDFDDVPEVWSNLGFAHLMRYCDALEPEDVHAFGFELGHLVASGFYSRPWTLEDRIRTRQIRESLWEQGVRALHRALDLDPTLSLPRAHLGIAYLVGPAGRRDPTRALALFDEAATLAETQPAVREEVRAAIAVHAAAAALATGRTAEFSRRLGTLDRFPAQGPDVRRAVVYGRAVVQSRSEAIEEREAALRSFQAYLEISSPASLWWRLGYERYRELAQALGRAPQSADELRAGRRVRHRRVTSAEVPPGVVVSLGQPTRELVEALGGGEPERLVPGTDILRLRFPDVGLEVLSTRGRIKVITLRGPPAPALSLVPAELGARGAEVPGALRVGMSSREVEALVGSPGRSLDDLTGRGSSHALHLGLGVAVGFRDDAVSELVIVPLVDPG